MGHYYGSAEGTATTATSALYNSTPHWLRSTLSPPPAACHSGQTHEGGEPTPAHAQRDLGRAPSLGAGAGGFRGFRFRRWSAAGRCGACAMSAAASLNAEVRGRRRDKMAAAGLLPVVGLFLLVLPGALGKRSQVKTLTDGTWRDLLQGEWMIEL